MLQYRLRTLGDRRRSRQLEWIACHVQRLHQCTFTQLGRQTLDVVVAHVEREQRRRDLDDAAGVELD